MSLITLTALEIVLGIDNLIFLSIVSGRLPLTSSAPPGRSASWPCSGAWRCCSPHLDHRPDRARALARAWTSRGATSCS